MKRTVFRFTFDPKVNLGEVEETFLLSVYGAEGIHGAARVRLECGYLLDARTRTLVVDAATAVGETVVQLFTGYVTREFGEDTFKVERVDGEGDGGGGRGGDAGGDGNCPCGLPPAGAAR